MFDVYRAFPHEWPLFEAHLVKLNYASVDEYEVSQMVEAFPDLSEEEAYLRSLSMALFFLNRVFVLYDGFNNSSEEGGRALSEYTEVHRVLLLNSPLSKVYQCLYRYCNSCNRIATISTAMTRNQVTNDLDSRYAQTEDFLRDAKSAFFSPLTKCDYCNESLGLLPWQRDISHHGLRLQNFEDARFEMCYWRMRSFDDLLRTEWGFDMDVNIFALEEEEEEEE